MKSDQAKFLEIIDELPDYCMMYFMSKADTYKPRTKVTYAIDLKSFFWYLIDALPDRFPYAKISDIPKDSLNTLVSDDIVMYMAYLNEYSMKDSDGSYPTKLNHDGNPEIIVYKNGPAAKKRKLAALKSFFKYMMVNRKLTNDPTVYVDIPKLDEKAIITLSKKEEKKLKDCVSNGSGKTDRGKKFFEKTKYRDLAIITLFLGTGLRISELCGLNMFDFDFEERRILVARKGHKQEFVYFNQEVLSTLTDYIEFERPQLLKEAYDKKSDGPLFVSNRGTRITVNRVEMIIKEYGRQVLPPNVKISAHLLRKTYGTNVYEKSGDLPLAQHALGHSDPSTTAKFYIKFDENRLKKLRE